LAERVAALVAVLQRLGELLVAHPGVLAGLADELTDGVVADQLGEGRRAVVDLLEGAVDLVANLQRPVEAAFDLRRLAREPERARVERIDRAARRALERVLEGSAGGERGQPALQRADADLRQRPDLEERQRAGQRSACGAGEDTLPVLAFADGLDGADAAADD